MGLVPAHWNGKPVGNAREDDAMHTASVNTVISSKGNEYTKKWPFLLHLVQKSLTVSKLYADWSHWFLTCFDERLKPPNFNLRNTDKINASREKMFIPTGLFSSEEITILSQPAFLECAYTIRKLYYKLRSELCINDWRNLL